MFPAFATPAAFSAVAQLRQSTFVSRAPPASHVVTAPGAAPARRTTAPSMRFRRRPRANIEVPKSLNLTEPLMTIDGVDYDFASTKGKVILAVNVATMDKAADENFSFLTDLHNQYSDAGFEVIAFPCNWFGQKEPGSDEEIAERVRDGWGSKFTVMSKLANLDLESNPVFEQGIACFPGDIIWNFQGKFLFDKSGRCVARFDLLTTPEYIESRIEKLLSGF
jgi:glutathione peroxidase-family protein